MGHNGFALQISQMICEHMEGKLDMVSETGIHGQHFITYIASFKDQGRGSGTTYKGSSLRRRNMSSLPSSLVKRPRDDSQRRHSEAERSYNDQQSSFDA